MGEQLFLTDLTHESLTAVSAHYLSDVLLKTPMEILLNCCNIYFWKPFSYTMMHNISDIILAEISLRFSVISTVNKRSGVHEAMDSLVELPVSASSINWTLPSQYSGVQLFKD